MNRRTQGPAAAKFPIRRPNDIQDRAILLQHIEEAPAGGEVLLYDAAGLPIRVGGADGDILMSRGAGVVSEWRKLLDTKLIDNTLGDTSTGAVVTAGSWTDTTVDFGFSGMEAASVAHSQCVVSFEVSMNSAIQEPLIRITPHTVAGNVLTPTTNISEGIATLWSPDHGVSGHHNQSTVMGRLDWVMDAAIDAQNDEILCAATFPILPSAAGNSPLYKVWVSASAGTNLTVTITDFRARIVETHYQP